MCFTIFSNSLSDLKILISLFFCAYETFITVFQGLYLQIKSLDLIYFIPVRFFLKKPLTAAFKHL